MYGRADMKRIRTRKIYDRLNGMLDDAIAGRFKETDYDESELSKLEVKWKRYLTSSFLSAQKIENEHTVIQELVTDISHQTKTPLSNILLYSQLLEEQPLNPEAENMVKEIRKQSEKLEFLIQSLVKTSRLESGTFRLYPEEKQLYALLEGSVKYAEAKAREKDIRITIKSADSKESLRAVYDEKWTKEALFNILDNAIKYSPAGTEVIINVIPYEMFLCIEIKDSGIGIEADEIPEIFGRFYRGKNVRNKDGVGIGLYLSRQIIEAQGGYIKVSSQVSSGTRFLIYLPKK